MLSGRRVVILLFELKFTAALCLRHRERIGRRVEGEKIRLSVHDSMVSVACLITAATICRVFQQGKLRGKN